MKTFTHSTHAQRVVFGTGTLDRLSAEINTLGATRALVLSTPGQRSEAKRVASILGSACVGIYDRAEMHVPIETAREARTLARRLGADCAVAVGGGSTIGLGKAIALESGLPILAIPTTYAGSEMTAIYGITEAGLKKTGNDARVLPRTVVYDIDLTRSLPLEISVTSGMNALAHAAESLYAADINPVVALMSQEGIAALGRAMPAFASADDAKVSAARADALYGAWLCGTALSGAGVGLHHKLCHTLGGSFDLPHAQVHTIVLPHALAYNAPAAPEAMARIAQALGCTNAAQGVFDLARGAGASMALKDLGLRGSDLDRACALAMENRYPNPRPLEARAIRQLLQNAFDGDRPAP